MYVEFKYFTNQIKIGDNMNKYGRNGKPLRTKLMEKLFG